MAFFGDHKKAHSSMKSLVAIQIGSWKSAIFQKSNFTSQVLEGRSKVSLIKRKFRE